MKPHQSPKLRSNRRDWIIIIAIALLAHLAFFIFFKPQYLQIFKTDIAGVEGQSPFPSMDRPFSLISLPEQSENHRITVQVQTSDESQPENFILDELGEIPSELLPMEKGSRAGKDSQLGHRKTTVEPKPLFIPWPKYPESVEESVEGRVELLLFVNEKGEVEEVKIVRGLPHELLNRVATDSARKIRFTPGMEKGIPTAMWVRLTIGFQPR